ncbi:HigA family addiction module antitoxin [Methylorubrum rhodesianum]|uniref:HigA family addiction module antitoxin n=1 Tax=Methylorubrum TaxID=2282523 RepID=UPI0016185570|nr:MULTISPECIES: HigA family addiction module antitoxin [Methylorubrum]MBB5765706.1 addiction module HigA family antidote [Methylorubrum rhodesianum]MBI1691525.1 addiction module antidote protein, HigA family [Methylorubrum sp. DB1722]
MTETTTLAELRALDLTQIEEIASPIHPGEILREEYLVPLNLSAGAVARACGVPRTRIERIATEETGISTDTALRLGRYFGTTPAFWLNLQREFELATLQQEVGDEIGGIVPLTRDAA